MERWVLTLDEVTSDDTERVGGKNASLGEMIQSLSKRGIRVPSGFATTAKAYVRFLQHNGLDERIAEQEGGLRGDDASARRAGESIREAFLKGEFPEEVAVAVRDAYRNLSARCGREEIDVAVRSSATAEDLPDASFAGQQDTFLNVSGEEELLDACRRCYASLFTDRAISYRTEQGFDHREVALSVGVQQMVRSDLAGAGVLFTLDPDTGFRDVVVIDASWGLGETVVQGSVDPDEYVVFKPLLENDAVTPILAARRGAKAQKLVYSEKGGQNVETVETSKEERRARVLDDDEILLLARWGTLIETHYRRPMDVEWARDGRSGEIFVIQARPETIHGEREPGVFRRYTLRDTGDVLVSGLGVGEAVATGPVCRIRDASEIDRFVADSVLVTPMTDPDWVPIMKQAAAIVTDHGGRTSHAAIVSRELGVAAVVGTGDASAVLRDEQGVTVACTEGRVYDGISEYDVEDLSVADVPSTRTKLMLSLASPGSAFRWARLPADGVGLARLEFVINDAIKVHPLALIRPDELHDEAVREQIADLTRGWPDPESYFVDQLASGIARIAACQHPRRVVVRTSDFKTNEYAALMGGEAFEHEEANPMLGFRGASRYYSDRYRDAFALECRAICRVREEIGLDNVEVMIPFCRTPEEADRVLEVLAANGLIRGRGGLSIHAMCETPSNVFLAEEFAERFDGFSIGSNDLTQLVLGVDRDSEELAALFDEGHPAVTRAIRDFIARVHARGGTVGFCGQAPSDDSGFARLLVEAGIDSISVSPDSFLAAKRAVAAAEAALAAPHERGG